MAKKILKVTSLGLIGGKKKKKPKPEEGPVITPLGANEVEDARRPKRRTISGGQKPNLGGLPSILSDKLGG